MIRTPAEDAYLEELTLMALATRDQARAIERRVAEQDAMRQAFYRAALTQAIAEAEQQKRRRTVEDS